LVRVWLVSRREGCLPVYGFFHSYPRRDPQIALIADWRISMLGVVSPVAP
jgi:hypothetical protein